MKKNFIVTLSALALLSACSDRADQWQQSSLLNNTAVQQLVQFDTYIGPARTVNTRGGAYGSIDTEVLKGSNYGFGVFAYKTGTTAYSDYRTQNATEKRYPNFMYNEPILWNGTTWTYAYPTNVKYWPNEQTNSTTTDDQNNNSGNDPATSSAMNGGNVSFFAYGPYVAEATKVTTSGIVGQGVSSTDDGGIMFFSTANFNGGKADAASNQEKLKYSDPYLKYKLPLGSDRQVDLLWGTMGNTSDNVLGNPQLGMWADDGSLPEVDKDGNAIATRPHFMINTDLTRQKTNGTVNFLFKHALAKIGGSYVGTGDTGSDEDPLTPTNGLMVILDIDKDTQESGGALFPYAETPTVQTPYNTKVTINEIVLHNAKELTAAGRTAIQNNTTFDYSSSTYTQALTNTGIFNLVTGVWSNLATESYTSGAVTRTQTIVPSVDASTDASRDAILHPSIAEPSSFTTTAYTRERYEELPVGVTTVAKNVYKNDAQPFVFIPGTYPIVTVTIDYTVRSYDAKLADNYTEVRQRITKRLYILDEIKLNKQYNILMHLGLTSVKFTATVDDWAATDAHIGTTTDPGSGQSVVQTYDTDVEHVYLPANVE
jgi:hypothetical protein